MIQLLEALTLWAIAIVILILLIITILCLLGPVFKGAPFIPTSYKKTQIMLQLAQLKPGDVLVDLGSGDGRLLIAAAKAGADCYGYEINPLLTSWSRWRAKRHGVAERVTIKCQDFWSIDLKPFDVIVFYGRMGLSSKIERKIDATAQPGTKIITHDFTLPNKQPLQHKNGIFLYQLLEC